MNESNGKNHSRNKEGIKMPSCVLEAIELSINHKSNFEINQELQIKKLHNIKIQKLTNSRANKIEIIRKKLIRAGILDENGNLTKPYDDKLE